MTTNILISLISLGFTAVGLLAAIIGIYVKLKTDMAKIMIRVTALEKEQDKDDEKFKLLFNKIDELKDLILSK